MLILFKLAVFFLFFKNQGHVYHWYLSFFIGEKFGFDARKTTVTDEGGAEIDSIDVIRDNDKLFIVEDLDSVME